ncbi:MAG: hypothetical protein K8S98_06615 [Planctomycetes bacterium]|nr:hypothetical protein [Planctomycetota bacterium]
MWIALCFSMLQSAAQKSAPEEFPYRDLFGVSIDDAGDLDGDGIHDLWIGDPSMLTELDEPSGCVWAVSGKTGKCLRRIEGPPNAWGFGWTLAALSDIDGDGKRGVAVGCEFTPSEKTPLPAFEIRSTSPAGESTVFAFSGATGQQCFVVTGPADTLKNAWYTADAGPALASVGDWNGDGAGDLAIGWSFADSEARDCGRVDVVSGKDGKTLHSWTGVDAHDRFGFSLAALADLDGDGKCELGAGAVPDYAPNAGTDFPSLTRRRTGYVRVLSSKGSTLYSLAPGDSSWGFGGSIATFPDVDRDGVSDVMIGQPYDVPVAITVWSGRTGKFIRRLDPPELDAWDGGWASRNMRPAPTEVCVSFGTRLLLVSDHDHDGLADILATTPQTFCHVPAGILSSASGKVLDHVELDSSLFTDVGIAAAQVGDLNSDGVDDIAIGGSSIRSDDPGVVILVSGKTLTAKRTIRRSDMQD